MRQWQLIVEQIPQTGAYNMAVDETLLEQVAAGARPPTLRLYRWHPFCLSLGYGQAAADVDQVRLAARGWDLVRRPTGGKAILHGDEVTYSVALPLEDELARGDVLESYRRLSEGLMAALVLLGLTPVSEKAHAQTSARGPVCFEVPSHYEITVHGRKLIGSAQVRRRAGLLQHGTLPLYGDIASICEVLPYESEVERDAARVHVRARAATLQDVLGRRVDEQEAMAALAAGFEQTFSITFTEGELTAEEQAQVEKRARTYLDAEWTHKR